MRRLLVVGVALALAVLAGCWELGIETAEKQPTRKRKPLGPRYITPAQARICQRLAFQDRIKRHRFFLNALLREKAVALKGVMTDATLGEIDFEEIIQTEKYVEWYPLLKTKYKNVSHENKARQDYIRQTDHYRDWARWRARKYDLTISERLPKFCGPHVRYGHFGALIGLPPVRTAPVSQPAPKAKPSSGTMTQPDASPPAGDDADSLGGG